MSKEDELIDHIENIRHSNNANWMELLRIAMKHDPAKARAIVKKIYKEDMRVCQLVRELVE